MIANSDLISRLVKQVNLPYIAWVAAYNTTILLSYLLLDLAFFPTPLAKSTYSPVSGLKVVCRPSNSSIVSPTRAVPFPPSVPPGSPTTPTQGPRPMPSPALLDAINRNSLAVFLVVRFPSIPFLLLMIWHGTARQANVATGVVNLWMQTMYTSDGLAMGVLAAYAFGVCAFAWAMRGQRALKL